MYAGLAHNMKHKFKQAVKAGLRLQWTIHVLAPMLTSLRTHRAEARAFVHVMHRSSHSVAEAAGGAHLMVFAGVCALVYRGVLMRALLVQAAQRGKPLFGVHVITHCMVPLKGDHGVSAPLHMAQPPVVVEGHIEGLHHRSHHGICAEVSVSACFPAKQQRLPAMRDTMLCAGVNIKQQTAWHALGCLC